MSVMTMSAMMMSAMTMSAMLLERCGHHGEATIAHCWEIWHTTAWYARTCGLYSSNYCGFEKYRGFWECYRGFWECYRGFWECYLGFWECYLGFWE